MKRRHVSAKTLAGPVLAAVLLLGGHAEQSRAAGQPHLRTYHFGGFGLSEGQTANLNVVNTIEDPNLIEDPNIRNRGIRRVTLAFDIFVAAGQIDGGSRLLTRYKWFRRESETVTLWPGEAVSLNFSAPADTRVTALVVSSPADDGNQPNAQAPDDANPRGAQEPDHGNRSHLLTTLEVREAGRTVFMHPGSLGAVIPDGPDKQQ